MTPFNDYLNQLFEPDFVDRFEQARREWWNEQLRGGTWRAELGAVTRAPDSLSGLRAALADNKQPLHLAHGLVPLDPDRPAQLSTPAPSPTPDDIKHGIEPIEAVSYDDERWCYYTNVYDAQPEEPQVWGVEPDLAPRPRFRGPGSPLGALARANPSLITRL